MNWRFFHIKRAWFYSDSFLLFGWMFYFVYFILIRLVFSDCFLLLFYVLRTYSFRRFWRPSFLSDVFACCRISFCFCLLPFFLHIVDLHFSDFCVVSGSWRIHSIPTQLCLPDQITSLRTTLFVDFLLPGHNWIVFLLWSDRFLYSSSHFPVLLNSFSQLYSFSLLLRSIFMFFCCSEELIPSLCFRIFQIGLFVHFNDFCVEGSCGSFFPWTLLCFNLFCLPFFWHLYNIKLFRCWQETGKISSKYGIGAI